MKAIRHVGTLFHYDGPQVFEARDAIGGRNHQKLSLGFSSSGSCGTVPCRRVGQRTGSRVIAPDGQ